MTRDELIEQLKSIGQPDSEIVVEQLDGYSVKSREKYENYDLVPDPRLRADGKIALNA